MSAQEVGGPAIPDAPPRVRLIAGTINRYPDTEQWRNIHLDAADRPIYDQGTGIMVRPDVIAKLQDELPMFPDETFDEVRCWHVIEHMSLDHAGLAFAAIYRVLRPGGTFDVETPDMDRIASAWTTRAYSLEELQQWIHGEDMGGAFDGHRSSWNEGMLHTRLEAAGFRVGPREETGLAVRLIARKP